MLTPPFSIVISVFGIIILSVVASLFAQNHHSMVGGEEDPKNGPAVASTVWASVVVYAVFLVGCSLNAVLHKREARRGAIVLS